MEKNRGLSREKLAQLPGMQKDIDDDEFSEFSVMTDESELVQGENILDLRIGNVEFDPKVVNKVLNMTNAMPQAV